MTTKDRLVLIGQVLETARWKRKLLDEPLLVAINRIEKSAQFEKISQQNIDDWIQQGREIVRYKQRSPYGNVKYIA